jgi:hypothetical protein
MVGNEKRTYEIKLRLTEREYLDFTRICEMRDRTQADQAHVVIKTYLYGHAESLLKSFAFSDSKEPKHELPLVLPNGLFVALSQISILKNKAIMSLLLSVIKDYIFGHVKRIHDAEQVTNKAHRDE